MWREGEREREEEGVRERDGGGGVQFLAQNACIWSAETIERLRSSSATLKSTRTVITLPSTESRALLSTRMIEKTGYSSPLQTKSNK